MDVQVVAGGGAPQQQAPTVVSGQPDGASPGVQNAPPPTVPSLPPQQQSSSSASRGSLSAVAAKIFSGASQPHGSVNVSFRIENDPHVVVMVFTDPATGQEISQVPSEVMVQLAAFFDKHSGVTLDQTA